MPIDVAVAFKHPSNPRRQRLAWAFRTDICAHRYSETVDLLYSANGFTVFDSDVMYYLPSILLPEHVNSIRSLRFIWDRLTTPSLGPRPESAIQQWVEDAERQARWTRIWHNIK